MRRLDLEGYGVVFRKSAKDVFTLSEADVTCAEEVLKGMKPMKDAILVMSEEKMPTLSLIAPLHDNLVKSTAEMEDDSATVKEIKLAIAQDLGKRYTNANETLYMASAVDPRFKDLLFLTEQKKTETYSRLTDAVTDVIKKKRNQEAEVMDSDNPVPVVREEDQEAADHSPNSKDGTDATPHPPQKKPRSLCLLVSLLGDTYASTGDEAPQSAVAKRFLCIPGTSVSSERVFSTTGDIVTAQRSVLKAGHVDQLVFLNRNLTIKN
ncbi:hypothetical protein COCON_G00120020 [Conger conger]|uniref:HAT C-terminal dimerisation domain-containing protein n=1 Tax=Conger conger TaxID=82655 RepID=A0A9Q1HY11_CONCO|nr:hypothetical protein COCON_G00120020 [Conger conger]